MTETPKVFKTSLCQRHASDAYRKRNLKKYAELAKIYYHANRETINARRRERYQQQKNELNAKRREKYKTHKETEQRVAEQLK